jgi:hypothetical protein
MRFKKVPSNIWTNKYKTSKRNIWHIKDYFLLGPYRLKLRKGKKSTKRLFELKCTNNNGRFYGVRFFNQFPSVPRVNRKKKLELKACMSTANLKSKPCSTQQNLPQHSIKWARFTCWRKSKFVILEAFPWLLAYHFYCLHTT